MKTRRLGLLFAVLGCLSVGVLAPAAGCNGTGTTPVCDFLDGAPNPESGCGVLVEAAVAADAFVADAPPGDTSPPDSPPGKPDASDATAPDAADAHAPDAGDGNVPDAHLDAHFDAHLDAKG